MLAASNESIVALILAILASVVKFEVHRVESAQCFFIDYAALGFGAAAMLAGVIAILVGMRGNDLLSTFFGGAGLLVGMWRAIYGAGLALGPCN